MILTNKQKQERLKSIFMDVNKSAKVQQVRKVDTSPVQVVEFIECEKPSELLLSLLKGI